MCSVQPGKPSQAIPECFKLVSKTENYKENPVHVYCKHNNMEKLNFWIVRFNISRNVTNLQPEGAHLELREFILLKVQDFFLVRISQCSLRLF